MTVYVAPKGTRVFAKGGWEPIGTAQSIEHKVEYETLFGFDGSKRMPTSHSIHIRLDDDRVIYAPSAKFRQVSDDELEIALDHYSFPQRYMLGIDQEDTLARTSIAGKNSRNLTIDGYSKGRAVIGSVGKDGLSVPAATVEGVNIAKAARDLAGRVEGAGTLINTTMDGKDTVAVGNARVYQAESAGEAQRNLNFAIANLTSYIRYVDQIKVEQERKAKEAAEAKKREVEAKQAARNKAGLDLYNRVHGTRHMTWGSLPVTLSLSTREGWADKAEEITKLKRESNPFISIQDAVNRATINANAINTNRLFGF
jgi:hypothetical protein